MSGQDLGALLGDFLAEAEERTARVEQILLDLPQSGGDAPELIKRARRELHTLKGNAGMMGFDALRTATHELEDLSDLLDPEWPDIQPLLQGTRQAAAGNRRPRSAARPTRQR